MIWLRHFNMSLGHFKILGQYSLQEIFNADDSRFLQWLIDFICQNQAFLAEIRSWVMILLRKNATLAFIWYILKGQ